MIRAPFEVSTPEKLPGALRSLLREREIQLSVEKDQNWLTRMASSAPMIGEIAGRQVHRIRLIGGDAAELAHALRGSPDIAVYAGPVTSSGRIELLSFLREQSISITNHRFGNPTHITDEVI